MYIILTALLLFVILVILIELCYCRWSSDEIYGNSSPFNIKKYPPFQRDNVAYKVFEDILASHQGKKTLNDWNSWSYLGRTNELPYDLRKLTSCINEFIDFLMERLQSFIYKW